MVVPGLAVPVVPVGLAVPRPPVMVGRAVTPVVVVGQVLPVTAVLALMVITARALPVRVVWVVWAPMVVPRVWLALAVRRRAAGTRVPLVALARLALTAMVALVVGVLTVRLSVSVVSRWRRTVVPAVLVVPRAPVTVVLVASGVSVPMAPRVALMTLAMA